MHARGTIQALNIIVAPAHHVFHFTNVSQQSTTYKTIPILITPYHQTLNWRACRFPRYTCMSNTTTPKYTLPQRLVYSCYADMRLYYTLKDIRVSFDGRSSNEILPLNGTNTKTTHEMTNSSCYIFSPYHIFLISCSRSPHLACSTQYFLRS